MRKNIWAAALCLLLLAGCGMSGEALGTQSTETPTETEPATELLGFPIDESHDAFYVGNGEENGWTLLVTAAWENGAWQLSVWEAPELTQPIQTMVVSGNNYNRMGFAADVNFDGYMDFGYGAAEGVVNNAYYTVWLWNEEQGQFVESLECSALCNPQFDAVTGTVSSYVHRDAGAFTKDFYHWEDGKLVNVRRIDVGGQMVDTEDGSQLLPTLPEDPGTATQTLVVTDWVNGEPQEVYRRVFGNDGDAVFEEAERWHDLTYHGE